MPYPVIPPARPVVTLSVEGVTGPTVTVGRVFIRGPRPSLAVEGVASMASMRGPHFIYAGVVPVGGVPTGPPGSPGNPTPPPVAVTPGAPIPVASPAPPTWPFVPPITMDLLEPPLDAQGFFQTIVADVQGRVKVDWVDRMSDVGGGNVELLREISDGAGGLIPNPGSILWNPNRYMLCKLYGHAAICLMREAVTDTWVAPGEESQQTQAVTGAQSHAYKLADTAIRPIGQLKQYPIQQDVRMDWTSEWSFTRHFGRLNFDYSGYNLPFAVPSMPPLSDSQSFFYRPQNWPNDLAEWIWSQYGPPFPTGECIFYIIPGVPVNGDYQLWTSCFGPYEVWLNGVKIVDETKPFTGQAAKTDIYMQGEQFTHGGNPGGDLIAIKAQCVDPQLAGFLFSLHTRNPDGTATPGPVSQSGTNFRVIPYPATTPGMTAGNILLSLLAQSVDTHGQFQYWWPSFNGFVDSAGQPWPVLQDVAFPVGSTILDALRQLADSDIDWKVQPTAYILDAYVKDTLGVQTGMDLVSGYSGGNLRKLAYSWGV